MSLHVAWYADETDTMTLMVAGGHCAAHPQQNEAVYFSFGVTGVVGANERTWQFTPENAGAYYICGYLGQAESSDSLLTSFEGFTVRVPSDSVSVEVAPSSSEDTPVTITVTGETEGARWLQVSAGVDGCESASGGVITDGEKLGGGSFSKTFSYTPSEMGWYVVCASVGENCSFQPTAQGSAGFYNTTPSFVAAQERFAAELRAEVERREQEQRERSATTTASTPGASTPPTSTTGPSEAAGPTSPSSSEAAATISSSQLASALERRLAPTGRAGMITALLKRGGYTESLRALESGLITVDWYSRPSDGRIAAKTKDRPVLIASGRLLLASGETAIINIRLTAAGRKALGHVRHFKVTAVGRFASTGRHAVQVTRDFVLSS